MRIGRRGVDEDRVERQRAGLEQARDVREEDRDVVGAALVHRLAGVRTDEQRPVPEMSGHLGCEVRPRTLDVEMDDANVPQLRGARDQRIQQDGGRRRGTVEVDGLVRPDAGDGLGGRDDAHLLYRRRNDVVITATTDPCRWRSG